MFHCKEAKGKLTYTPRRELHGEERQPAASLHLEITQPAESLGMFSPTLRGTLFHKANHPDRDLADQASDAADLRHPEITNAIEWSLEMLGATLTIHHGLGGKSDLVLPDCNVDKFQLQPQQGAVVIIRFRVACHPDEKQAGRLYLMNGSDVEITLDPPGAEAEDLAGAKQPPKEEKEPIRGSRKAATKDGAPVH